MAFITGLTATALGIPVWMWTTRRWRQARQRRQLAFIDRFRYPTRLARETHKRYPHLAEADLRQVEQGLKQYFRLCVRSGGQMVSMPSQAVDAMWHAWILDTAGYQRFCRQAFGRFLHHRPAEAMPSRSHARAGIRRAWSLACSDEGLPLRQPPRVPLLFGLDRALAIPDGFLYVPDCRRTANEASSNLYCGADLDSGCDGGTGFDSAGSDDHGGPGHGHDHGHGSDGSHGGEGAGGGDSGCGGSCGSSCGGGCGGD